MSDNMSRAMQIMAEQERRIDRLRAAVEALVPLVQRDRDMLASFRNPVAVDGVAEYDAALALADAAMGNDVERAG